MKLSFQIISFSLPKKFIIGVNKIVDTYASLSLLFLLSVLSVESFLFFSQHNLTLQYNDARSHLDIGRRVVEGLKPGLAQLGSVWLPLPHILMIPTIWNDFMWHSGLAGALQSMLAFVATGILIYLFLKKIDIGFVGRLIGVFVFVANVNILYMQSTAMTELLLIATSMAGMYYLFLWQKDDSVLHLVKSAFWIMLSTLNRYDGWFLFGWGILIVGVVAWRKKGFSAAEGSMVFFTTLAGIGIVLWFLWNQLIFKDALYFILGPYSAHAQQQQLSDAGVLSTKHNFLLSLKVYYYALVYSVGMVPFLLGLLGTLLMFFDKKIRINEKITLSALWSPFVFNVLALYLGFSVLFVQGISGNTWFNVRYGILMIPSVAFFCGYLIGKLKNFRVIFVGLLLFVTIISFINADAVTIDDARVGSSQKNVSEVSGWLNRNAKDKKGFILISAASHDAIIFSSGLPMTRFIHEGTGAYWISATTSPDRWARWIIMRTNDVNDQTFRFVSKAPGFSKYQLVGHYPFADIYELRKPYLGNLHYTPVFGKQK